MNLLQRGPIFIGGLDNSGKTLLRLALSAHPNIAMTRRTYMWTRVYNHFGDLSQRDNFERCLESMLSLKDVRALRPDAERIRREFRLGEQTYGRLFALLHEHFAEQLGKSRWGEQEGRIEQYALDIFQAYPLARLIHMIRDPRNRYDEMLAATPPRVRLGRVGVITRDWLESVQRARRNQDRFPQNYTVLYYEKLIAHPEETLREVCAFVGEDYTPTMMTLEGALRFGSGPKAGSASEWETGVVDFRLEASQAVSRREVAFLQAFARREMTASGYVPKPIALSTLETLLYCTVDWPLGTMRMATGK